MTRASNIVVRYTGQGQRDPRDSLKTRAAQRAASKRRMAMIASTAGELIALLQSMDPSAKVLTVEPPFDGVKLVDQGNGSILICRPRKPASLSRSRSATA